MKTLGELIRELREERDLSLRELATKIEVSAAFMSDVELGRRHPSDKHMAAVARALGTSLEDIQQCDTRPPCGNSEERLFPTLNTVLPSDRCWIRESAQRNSWSSSDSMTRNNRRASKPRHEDAEDAVWTICRASLL